MAGVAEKARFYLERSVPQLREWEQKEIFTKVRPLARHKCLAFTNLSDAGRDPVHCAEAQ